MLRAHNDAERLSREGEFAAPEIREDLLSNSGLFLPGGERGGQFYHLSIQDFLTAERLVSIQAGAEDWLGRYAAEPRWRQTFGFWFGHLMRSGSPARALRAMSSLEGHLDTQALDNDPNAGLLWSDCLELAGAKAYAEYQTLKTLSMYEEMVVTGAWWDYVDDIGSHRLKTLVERYPKGMARRMRSWSKDPSLWKRRCSIICQLRRKLDTDLELLWDCIEVNLDDKEFFIRKAIGWALRDLAWEDLETVERYVAANQDRLSSLSKREALKNAEKIRASGRQ